MEIDLVILVAKGEALHDQSSVQEIDDLSKQKRHVKSGEVLRHAGTRIPYGKSTTTALIQLVDYILDWLEESCAVTSLFLDFTKAFACLSHDNLIRKMKALGITGKSSNWFFS
ncbi:hypothetical protein J6590_106657 [Homalodisca vitripennis]|nr:hypothetical protein J6590_106657 [Homalodisca vitripennis]